MIRLGAELGIQNAEKLRDLLPMLVEKDVHPTQGTTERQYYNNMTLFRFQ
jgi:hypothetical protein